jgi:uroporphyrinogen-III synthase
VIDGGGDARRLVAAIVASGERGPLLHPRGEDQAVDIVALLAAEGVEAREAVVYAQDAQPLNKDARDVLAGNVPVILPIFSPRTARILAASAAMKDRNAPLWIAALSPQIAEAARALAPQRMVIAAEPDAASLLGAMQDWFDPGRQP